MKKGLIILVFLTMSAAGFAQNDMDTAVDYTKIVKVEKPEAPKASIISAKVKAKVLKINRKKSNEIISIKAYRKSLQIKMKTVKLC